MEIWKDIKDYEGAYQVSNFGRVKSLDRAVNSRYGGKRKVEGVLLKFIPDKDNYSKVNLKKNQKGKRYFVHRLVAAAFIDNKENKPQVNHINGLKKDNNIKNLEWVTLSENRRHAYDTGLQSGINRRGEKNNFSKVTKNQVIEIRSTYKKGVVTYKELSEKFNISSTGIGSIIKRRSWAWL